MKQAEIWEIDLSPTIGAEIQKMRPAVIINDDAIGVLPLRVIVPITGQRTHWIWHGNAGGEYADSGWLPATSPSPGNDSLLEHGRQLVHSTTATDSLKT